MSVAKVIEISSTSKTSFEDAIKLGVQKAAETVDDIKGGWVSEMKVDVEKGKVTLYRVNLRLSFVVN
jgi:flavin-binding protein dodecin